MRKLKLSEEQILELTKLWFKIDSREIYATEAAKELGYGVTALRNRFRAAGLPPLTKGQRAGTVRTANNLDFEESAIRDWNIPLEDIKEPPVEASNLKPSEKNYIDVFEPIMMKRDLERSDKITCFLDTIVSGIYAQEN